MRRFDVILRILAVSLLPASAVWAQSPDRVPNGRPQIRQGNLKAGDMAPDFALEDVAGKQSVRLSSLRGKPVVLVFGSCTCPPFVR